MLAICNIAHCIVNRAWRQLECFLLNHGLYTRWKSQSINYDKRITEPLVGPETERAGTKRAEGCPERELLDVGITITR